MSGAPRLQSSDSGRRRDTLHLADMGRSVLRPYTFEAKSFGSLLFFLWYGDWFSRGGLGRHRNRAGAILPYRADCEEMIVR